MWYRITPHRQYEISRGTAQQQFSQSAKLQLDISSGVRVHRPSDDPTAQRVILNQQGVLDRLTGQLESLSQVRLDLNRVATETQNAQQLVVRAKSIALEARQTTDDSERSVLSKELESILGQLEQIANASAGGRYLFAGSRTQTIPYSGIADGRATYTGGDEAGEVALAGAPPFSVYYSGRDVFQPPSSGSLAIMGSTGIQPGAGTSSGSSPTTVIVRHTLTTYGGSSGIQSGASSAAGDTAIGTHQLTIRDTSGTGASGTISLNGGSEVAFTSADADLRITGPDGEVVYVDAQSIAAGFDGTVTLTADGTLSIDGGLTETPIDFSANQMLVNDSLGIVLHLDTQNVTRTGSDNVEFTASGDVFVTIQTLYDDLQNSRGLSQSDWNQALDRRLTELDAANDHLLQVIGEQSFSLQYLDQLEARLGDLKLASAERLTEAQATDYPSAIVDLQEQQNLLQYTLASLGAITNLSILDYLG